MSEETAEKKEKKELPEKLKQYQFKPGNKVAVGNKGGRPRTLTATEITNDDLRRLRNEIEKITDLGDIAERLVYNAFFHENKNGSYGSVYWAKIVLAYWFGQPPMKIESQHTNMVDMMRLFVEQNMGSVAPDILDGEIADD